MHLGFAALLPTMPLDGICQHLDKYFLLLLLQNSNLLRIAKEEPLL